MSANAPAAAQEGRTAEPVKFAAERWETDESIVTANGAPIGGTLRHADIAVVVRWLNERGGWHDLRALLTGGADAR